MLINVDGRRFHERTKAERLSATTKHRYESSERRGLTLHNLKGHQGTIKAGTPATREASQAKKD